MVKDFFIRLFTNFNAFLIRISRGRVGGKLGTQTILILHTLGRKSGRRRSTPIAYFHHQGNYLLVGSNWGRDYQADWYLNLRKQPRARIDVNGQTLQVLARFAEGEEYARLWAYVTGKHPPYLEYQKAASRRIPIVMLQPVN